MAGIPASIPATMRSLVAPRMCRPAQYEIREVPVPSVTLPTQVLLRVRAAAINAGDVQDAAGKLAIFHTPEYPSPLGIEGAGVVAAVGSAVEGVGVGDEVYALHLDRPLFRGPSPGFASEYALSEERFVLRKPAHLSFEEAASMLAVVVTAHQAMRRGLQLLGEHGLEGKTVFVPAALSSTGSMAVQMARSVYGASRTVSTASTAKLPLVERYLPGLVDQLVDYQRQRVRDAVPRGSVDLMFNTQRTTMDDGIPLLDPRAGVLVSVATLPSKQTAREMIGPDRFSWWIGAVLDAAQLVRRWKLRGTDIKYEMVPGALVPREDLEKAGELIALGKVKPVMSVVDLGDIEAVRKACGQVLTGKGGLGKLVIRIA